MSSPSGQGHRPEHSHGHNHRESAKPHPETEAELRALFEQPSWEERYGGRSKVWSGNVNPQLVAEAADLTPGRALDIGSGEGADAIWLAERGWAVTGLDFSTVALDRAAEHAVAAGVGEQTTWRHADIRTWTPGEERWDLVSSQFMHQLDNAMPAIVRNLADAVTENGTLLVVGHHPRDLDTGVRWSIGSALFTPEDLLPALDPAIWHAVAEVRAREWTPPDRDEPVRVHDSVLLARRRS